MREADIAKSRLLAVPGDPLVQVEWHRVLFLNYVIDPEVVRALIPREFELDLYDGKASVSLVRVIMRNYRRAPKAPLWGSIFRAIKEQSFLNLRTYVRYHGEPGAFFIWGWLSRPLGLPLLSEPLGLTCAFADFREGCIWGKNGAFVYDHAHARPASRLTPAPSCLRGEGEECESGSINQFALERYTGFFGHRRRNYVFRAWHEPWLVQPANVRVADASLIAHRFPWFAKATFVDAAYAPLSDPVWLGRAHRLADHPHRARVFLEMP
jgi:uncharacterized protein YqjF (DUF2071 family)